MGKKPIKDFWAIIQRLTGRPAAWCELRGDRVIYRGSCFDEGETEIACVMRGAGATTIVTSDGAQYHFHNLTGAALGMDVATANGQSYNRSNPQWKQR